MVYSIARLLSQSPLTQLLKFPSVLDLHYQHDNALFQHIKYLHYIAFVAFLGLVCIAAFHEYNLL
jgi:hypothetical protein